MRPSHPFDGLYLLACFIFLLGLPTKGISQLLERLSPSIQGDSRYAKFNTTDLVVPYQGIDSWVELRAHWWLERKHIFAPYLSVTGSHMGYIPPCDTCLTFDWQRYGQITLGAELYPANIWTGENFPPYLIGVRLYGFLASRKYFTGADTTQATQAGYQKADARIGIDYYFDNIFGSKTPINWSLWADASGRMTNFSHLDYRVFLTSGILRVGHSFSFAKNDRRLFAYAFGDWLIANGCPCRWWENALKPGIGISFYPVKTLKTSSRLIGYKRFNLYLEWMTHVFWLGDPAPDIVSPWDIRFGISFSTSRLLGGK